MNNYIQNLTETTENNTAELDSLLNSEGMKVSDSECKRLIAALKAQIEVIKQYQKDEKAIRMATGR